jgi:large subunit ribosomal protein L6
MSRKGKLPILIPKDVEVKVNSGEITVKGPKGSLHGKIFPEIALKVEGNEVHVHLADDAKDCGNIHGLYRSLVQNMVTGTSEGFQVRLEMVGVGYRAAIQGKLLDLQLGFSHPTKLPIPEGITITVDKNTVIVVSGIDKQRVGQFAASIRAMKPPEPYQGKGIRYAGEYVRKKDGKSASKK